MSPETFECGRTADEIAKALGLVEVQINTDGDTDWIIPEEAN